MLGYETHLTAMTQIAVSGNAADQETKKLPERAPLIDSWLSNKCDLDVLGHIKSALEAVEGITVQVLTPDDNTLAFFTIRWENTMSLRT